MDMGFRYTPLNRPPHTFAMPKGPFMLVERPAQGYDFERRTDLPKSEFRHGVVEYERELSQDEVASFELRRVL